MIIKPRGQMDNQSAAHAPFRTHPHSGEMMCRWHTGKESLPPNKKRYPDLYWDIMPSLILMARWSAASLSELALGHEFLGVAGEEEDCWCLQATEKIGVTRKTARKMPKAMDEDAAVGGYWT